MPPITPEGRKRRLNSEDRSKPTKTVAYVLNHRLPTAAAARSKYRPVSIHHQRSQAAYGFFTDHVACDDVIAKDFMQASTFNTYLKSELRRHPPGSMAIIYLHTQKAGLNGKEWGFFLDGLTLERVILYDSVQIMIESGIHCVFLFDGYIPERFKDAWKSKDCDSHVEIIARGEMMQMTDESRMEDDKGDFSTCLFEDLDTFVTEIDTTYSRYHKPLSIAELLSRNPNMSCNIRRKWVDRDRSRYHGCKIVERALMLPDEIRELGKIQFYSVRIQGPTKNRKILGPQAEGRPQKEDREASANVEDEAIFMEEEEIVPGRSTVDSAKEDDCDDSLL
ncbi:Hypothetical predicted protein [Lecanosticta acicola]|uniref:Uncharacterized protein n=1 Tax=Lecanosticta acicola TaxID=111012 RepID=A0AAI8YZ39_9PEZI|nr:Hypothetical predicted protein [Lecanosticta acicola]